MNIVIPMAGRGSRFVEVGVTVPKPLIPVRGRPMYSWAVDSLPLTLARRLIFICLEEHLATTDLGADITSRYASLDPVVVPLRNVTDGQACTVLEARELIDDGTPLIIFNADTYCRTRLAETLTALAQTVSGVLGVFEASGDKWSFARTDESGRVVETAEKRRISRWASTGLYHFTRGCEFVEHTDAMVAANERVRGEFYVAPVYNRLIAAGGNVRLDVAEEVWALGTPDDLTHFETNYPRDK